MPGVGSNVIPSPLGALKQIISKRNLFDCKLVSFQPIGKDEMFNMEQAA
jgi:hypothetical protein